MRGDFFYIKQVKKLNKKIKKIYKHVNPGSWAWGYGSWVPGLNSKVLRPGVLYPRSSGLESRILGPLFILDYGFPQP